MTQDEFDKTQWRPGMKVKHAESGGVYGISSVDFFEKTVGLKNFTGGTDELHWARCENVEIVRV